MKLFIVYAIIFASPQVFVLGANIFLNSPRHFLKYLPQLFADNYFDLCSSVTAETMQKKFICFIPIFTFLD
jgi:hypothetical protein